MAQPLPETADAPPADIHAAYRDNLPRHLIGLARDLQARVMGTLTEEHGYQGLRLRFGPLLSLLWFEGRSVGELASALAISKQACSQLATAIEAAGYLERRPHPSDRRARLLVLTRRGRRLTRHGAESISRVDALYQHRAGHAAYAAFVEGLAGIYPLLDLPPRPGIEQGGIEGGSAGLLPLISEGVQRWLMHAAIARGHDGLKMSHGQVLPFIGPAGGRIQAIANMHGVSRQAIHAIAKDLEALGYLGRRPEPRDGRGFTLVLTRRGERLIDDSVDAVRELDERFAGALGEATDHELRRVARTLYEALELEGEVFDGTPDVTALAHRLRDRLSDSDARRLASLLGEGPSS